MKLDLLLSRVFGFYPHAGPSIEESPKNVRTIPATRVFRGLRYHRDQTPVDAATPAHEHALRIFRGRPAAKVSGLREREDSGHLKTVRVFRGSIVQ